MHVRPISPDLLAAELVARIDALPGRWARVAVDGAPAAETGDFADALVEPLRILGREVVRVRMADYLRPASLRLEHGHHDPDSFYESWFDFKALTRRCCFRCPPRATARSYRPSGTPRRIALPACPAPPSRTEEWPLWTVRCCSARAWPSTSRSTCGYRKPPCGGEPRNPTTGPCPPTTATPKKRPRNASRTTWSEQIGQATRPS